MTMEKFKGEFEVHDGFVGGKGVINFTISDQWIEDWMTEEELKDLYDEEMYNKFKETVGPVAKNKEEFVEWAKQIQLKMKEN